MCEQRWATRRRGLCAISTTPGTSPWTSHQVASVTASVTACTDAKHGGHHAEPNQGVCRASAVANGRGASRVKGDHAEFQYSTKPIRLT